jgi:hypothetical protein
MPAAKLAGIGEVRAIVAAGGSSVATEEPENPAHDTHLPRLALTLAAGAS